MQKNSKIMTKEYSFDAILKEIPENGGAYVIFPWDIRLEFGKGRVKVHALFDGHPEAGTTVTFHPAFRFITQDAETNEIRLLARGITSNHTQYAVDEAQGIYTQTGSLGRSSVQESYTLGVFRNLYTKPLIPMETVTFQVQVQNPDTMTGSERVWQQQSDRSKYD